MTAKPLGPEAPVLSVEGDGLRFVWPGRQMTAYVDRLRDERGDTTAEVTFSALHNGTAAHILGPAKVNLLSDSAATRVANNLAKLAADDTTLRAWQADLHVMLHQVQTAAIRWHRTPPEPVNLADVPVTEGPVEHLVAPLIPKRAPTLIVANGGGGKSYLALALGVSVRTGCALPGLEAPAAPGRVLYLDWETNAQEHALRLRRIARGLLLRELPEILYLRMDQTIDQATWLRAEIARQAPALVIVDSVGYAVGGDLKEAGTATQLFRIVNSWDTSVLVNHHENRDGGFYGTIFLRNSGRSMWIMESLREGPDLRLSLKHDKMNNGPLRADPLGLRLHFDANGLAVQWHSLDVYATPSLRALQPARDQLRMALREVGQGMTVEELVRETGLSDRTLKDTAKENPGLFVFTEGRGRGNKAEIGLRGYESVPF
jgi:hypothetical protein